MSVLAACPPVLQTHKIPTACIIQILRNCQPHGAIHGVIYFKLFLYMHQHPPCISACNQAYHAVLIARVSSPLPCKHVPQCLQSRRRATCSRVVCSTAAAVLQMASLITGKLKGKSIGQSWLAAQAFHGSNKETFRLPPQGLASQQQAERLHNRLKSRLLVLVELVAAR